MTEPRSSEGKNKVAVKQRVVQKYAKPRKSARKQKASKLSENQISNLANELDTSPAIVNQVLQLKTSKAKARIERDIEWQKSNKMKMLRRRKMRKDKYRMKQLGKAFDGLAVVDDGDGNTLNQIQQGLNEGLETSQMKQL